MKKKYKYIFGVLGLILFASLMTLLIFKKNSKSAEEAEAETVENAMEESSSKEELVSEEFEDEDLGPMEEDEDPPMYHVFVKNYEEIYTHYDDFKICNELPYYLHTYFNLCTGKLDEMYTVTLTKGSCVTSEESSYVRLEATVDKYPGMIIYIEYDKLNREFGIKSDLGDYSLEALGNNGKHYIIEYTPEDEDDSDYGAPDTVPVDPDEG